MTDDSSKIKKAIDATRDRVGDTLDSIANASSLPGRVTNSVGDTANALKGKLGDGADSLRGAMARAGDRLPDPEPLRRGVQSPIALVIGAAAVGFVAGLVLPLTDVERVRLEPIGDELTGWVSDARDEAVEQGRQVVAETISAARESAEKHGHDLAAALGAGASETESPTASGKSAMPTAEAHGTKSAVSAASKVDTASEPVPQSTGAANLLDDDASNKSEGVKTREALEKSGVITPPKN